MARSIPRLDLMIAYSCNISCAGCISISDRPREGVAPLADIVSWLEKYQTMITPQVVTLFGGEPCLHPQLQKICAAVRHTWPNTVIRLITNGYLLHRFDSANWFQHTPMEIQVSIHRKDHEFHINQAIRQILLHRQDWRVARAPQSAHEQLSWTSPVMKIYKSIFAQFITPFKSVNGSIEPWHSDPQQAHAICGSPDTPVLYKGKLYKCPAVANAMDLSGKNWFDYTACSELSQIDQFVDQIGCPETVCGQCPQLNQAVPINHMDKNNVIVKQKIPS